ncbi:4Fe-4S binding protein [Vibrio algarum]|uniref:4Fe-4S binding protein n=1 Tax=Vibrio algarum TaxID=3020714 RepID=A0ABT4YU96_9VIBR|nr:4Fe-4S binding protein [Vibrio sp. KJ40-1]MDB1125157.1 4Fe-4S binding protein [Vibrio sp. KJ40-1]
MLDSLTEENQQLVRFDKDIYQIVENNEQKAWLAVGSGVGYGGEVNIAVRMDLEGKVEQTSILSIKDTSSYVTKVIEYGLMNSFLGSLTKGRIDVDAVSGATLTSNGIIHATSSAIDPIREQIFGYRLLERSSPFDTVSFLDGLAVLFFMLAIYISRSTSIHKNKMQWTLMLASLVIFGFYSAALISSSTMGILISGSWSSGLGNYTAIILLILTIGYILLFNKNIYCQMICPMGTTQQCLSKLTSAKSFTLKHKALSWFPRVILLVALSCGLYFRNPAAFTFEPFGIMFGMVGSIYLFIPTILLLITSLFVHRPWCKTLCPINAMTDYLLFFKDWYKQTTKAKKRNKNRMDKPRKTTAKKAVSKRPLNEQPIPVKVAE